MYIQTTENKFSLKTTKIVWGINLVLFASLVFLGIEQAGRGAEISNLENKIEASSSVKRELSEKIFKYGTEDKLTQSGTELGFNKPSKILYFNSAEVSLTLK